MNKRQIVLLNVAQSFDLYLKILWWVSFQSGISNEQNTYSTKTLKEEFANVNINYFSAIAINHYRFLRKTQNSIKYLPPIVMH